MDSAQHDPTHDQSLRTNLACTLPINMLMNSFHSMDFSMQDRLIHHMDFHILYIHNLCLDTLLMLMEHHTLDINNSMDNNTQDILSMDSDVFLTHVEN